MPGTPITPYNWNPQVGRCSLLSGRGQHGVIGLPTTSTIEIGGTQGLCGSDASVLVRAGAVKTVVAKVSYLVPIDPAGTIWRFPLLHRQAAELPS
jgi:hypothetical protein